MSERKVTVAATQMACSWDIDANLANAESLVRKAADAGANIILIQELFATPYFCNDQIEKYFDLGAIKNERTGWGLFRDRRPELYGPIVTLSGCAPAKSLD